MKLCDFSSVTAMFIAYISVPLLVSITFCFILAFFRKDES